MIPGLSDVIARLSFFAKAGALAGALVGSFFQLLRLLVPGLSWGEAATAGLVFSLMGWLGVLLLFGIWLRYTIRQIWIQALIVSLLTGLVTIIVLQLWGTSFGGLIGFLIGILIGTILDWLCSWIFARKKYQIGRQAAQ